MKHPAQRRRIHWLVAAGAACAASCGCRAFRPTTAEPGRIDASDVLSQCAQRYTAAKSLEAFGTLEDARTAQEQRRRIALVLRRPAQMRIEIDRDVVVVQDRNVWTYDGQKDRFGKYRAFTNTPRQTAAELAAGGVGLLTVDLFCRGPRAFDDGPRGRADWMLGQLDFVRGRPCYVLVRETGGPRPARLRVWIDQDRFALLRWSIDQGHGADERTVVSMSYDDVRFDPPIDSAAFHISRPRYGTREP
ncbi:MAG: hypothetical protein L6Q92_05935 [Phycisphaerae bacterium]|nr:hypothetical protein [Phycisphaerae bacterium]